MYPWVGLVLNLVDVDNKTKRLSKHNKQLIHFSYLLHYYIQKIVWFFSSLKFHHRPDDSNLLSGQSVFSELSYFGNIELSEQMC